MRLGSGDNLGDEHAERVFSSAADWKPQRRALLRPHQFHGARLVVVHRIRRVTVSWNSTPFIHPTFSRLDDLTIGDKRATTAKDQSGSSTNNCFNAQSIESKIHRSVHSVTIDSVWRRSWQRWQYRRRLLSASRKHFVEFHLLMAQQVDESIAALASSSLHNSSTTRLEKFRHFLSPGVVANW